MAAVAVAAADPAAPGAVDVASRFLQFALGAAPLPATQPLFFFEYVRDVADGQLTNLELRACLIQQLLAPLGAAPAPAHTAADHAAAEGWTLSQGKHNQTDTHVHWLGMVATNKLQPINAAAMEQLEAHGAELYGVQVSVFQSAELLMATAQYAVQKQKQQAEANGQIIPFPEDAQAVNGMPSEQRQHLMNALIATSLSVFAGDAPQDADNLLLELRGRAADRARAGAALHLQLRLLYPDVERLARHVTQSALERSPAVKRLSEMGYVKLAVEWVKETWPEAGDVQRDLALATMTLGLVMQQINNSVRVIKALIGAQDVVAKVRGSLKGLLEVARELQSSLQNYSSELSDAEIRVNDPQCSPDEMGQLREDMVAGLSTYLQNYGSFMDSLRLLSDSVEREQGIAVEQRQLAMREARLLAIEAVCSVVHIDWDAKLLSRENIVPLLHITIYGTSALVHLGAGVGLGRTAGEMQAALDFLSKHVGQLESAGHTLRLEHDRLKDAQVTLRAGLPDLKRAVQTTDKALDDFIRGFAALNIR